MATWPTRGQKGPDFWDAVLKAYIDAGDAAVAGYTGIITRSAVASTGAGTNTIVTNPGKALFRMLYRIPRTATQVRFRYHNYNAITDVVGAQDVTLNVGVGIPAYDTTTGRPTGNFDASTTAPSQVVTDQVIAGGAAPFYSAPIDVSALPGKPGQFILVAFHVATSAASGSRSWQRSNVPTWWANEAAATDLLTGAVTVGSNAPALGDFSVVADCDSSESILFVGDSYSDGYGDVPDATMGGTHLSVPARLADLTGLPVATTAISGGRVEFYAERGDASPIWEKVGFANAQYTAAVLLSHPSNDTGSGRTVAQIQADYLTVLAKLRGKGIGRILGVTVPPRGNLGGILSAAVAVGDSTFQGNYAAPVGPVQIGTDAGIETVSVTSVAGAAAPYTLTISGAFTKPHAVAEVYDKSTQSEAIRQAINYWLRGRPGGLLDVIDLDDLYRDPANPIQLLASKRYDAVHINGTEYDNVARLIKAALLV